MPSFLDRFTDRPLPPLFGLFLCFVLYGGVMWYQGLEAPSAEQTAYIGGLMAGVIGFIKYYCEMLKQ
jgi:membrane associated rhomboid family serine protease